MNAPRRAAKHLSIRSVPPALSKALEAERRRSGLSLNQTVLDVLARALGVSRDPARTNGLEKHAGGWSARDLAEFEKATACFEQIDEDLWK